MAVTAHYIAESMEQRGQLELRGRLIAFRHVKGKHDGSNLGDTFVEILKEWGIERKVRLHFKFSIEGTR